jgi:signal transduction histidine kinase
LRWCLDKGYLAAAGPLHDDGAGVPEEPIDKVFERVETDPEKEGGTGLGLAIVKEVVEAHGG